MTDVDHPADQGDAPDTVDDRLADIARLIDTLADEVDPGHRLAHRAVIVLLLARLGRDVLARVGELLDRLDATP
jgi:hypothetical protein